MDYIKNNVTKEVVFLNNIELRLIPGYAYAYAGSDGIIRQISPSGKVIYPRPKEFKSTKGTYLYVTIIDEEFILVTKPVHRLICLAFHGKPETTERTPEPNHINGNKHDNSPSNLEWITHSGNVQHAYNTGLTTQGLRIEVQDLLSKETKLFHTLSHCAREFNISRNCMRDIIGRHRSVPYQDRFIFTIDDSSDKKVTRYQKTNVIVKDYLRNEIKIYSSYNEAGQETGIKSLTLRYNAVNRKDKLVSGFVIRSLDRAKETWPAYSKEEVELSVKNYPRIK